MRKEHKKIVPWKWDLFRVIVMLATIGIVADFVEWVDSRAGGYVTAIFLVAGLLLFALVAAVLDSFVKSRAR